MCVDYRKGGFLQSIKYINLNSEDVSCMGQCHVLLLFTRGFLEGRDNVVKLQSYDNRYEIKLNPY